MFEQTTLSSLDIAFFASSLTGTLLIGLYFANKNKTYDDYARGGGDQNLWAVSASMAASFCSALTLIGNPSELYMHGTSYTLTMTTTLVAWPIASFVFLPVFKRLDGISIFQYIEARFSPALRRLVSLMYILQIVFYTALSLYLPSLPLYTALKIPQSVSVGLIGLISIVYSSFGGIQAVTWSNLYHSILLILSMLSIIIAGTIQSGGLKRVIDVSYEYSRLSAGPDYFRFDLTSRHTIYNQMISYTLVRLFLHGTHQMQVQSALSLSSIRKSQASQLISGILYMGLQVVASAIGLIIFVNYKDCDPYLSGQIQRQDELLMHYVSNDLSSIPIVQGMFIAAVFGSTLTTMSSFQSSTSTIVVDDFMKPLWLHSTGKKLDDKLAALVGKCASLALGIACVLLTFEISRLSALLQATTTLYAAIGMPILSAFVLGTTTRFVNTKGMLSGMLLALFFGLYVFWVHAKAPPLEPSLPVSVANCTQELNQVAAERLASSKWFNGTLEILTSNQEVEGLLMLDSTRGNETIDKGFSIASMSYLWLSLISMLISVSVASVVSLLTGGLNQRVEDEYLAPFLCSSRKGELNFHPDDLKKVGAKSHELSNTPA